MCIKGSLTVLFEAPFWVGIYERTISGEYEVCKITFGAEPKDYEVYAFLLENWHSLAFSPSVKADGEPKERKINPKRMQRNISKALEVKGIGTKAQLALQLQRQQLKEERHAARKEQREAEKDRLYELKQKKKKEKHRGR